MKKIIMATLILMLTLSLAACGNGNSSDSSSSSADSAQTTATSESSSSETAESSTTVQSASETSTSETSSQPDSSGKKHDIKAMEADFTKGYAGVTESGNMIYFAINDKSDKAILVIFDLVADKYQIYAQTAKMEGKKLTITDDIDNQSITFEISEEASGQIKLTFEDDMGALEKTSVNEAIISMHEIADNSTKQ